jgi:hypothetical protein
MCPGVREIVGGAVGVAVGMGVAVGVEVAVAVGVEASRRRFSLEPEHAAIAAPNEIRTSRLFRTGDHL